MSKPPRPVQSPVSRVGRRISAIMGAALAVATPRAVTEAFASSVCRRDPHIFLQAFGPQLNRKLDLDTMPFDLAVGGELGFEHLAGLFASTSLDHGVISMTVRQTAYIYGLVKSMKVRKAIEIGRYKGGSTLVIAAAMGGQGEFWSLDIGEKEERLRVPGEARRLDDQIADALKRFGLQTHLIVGDSRTLALETGDVDFVFIDGDHTYEGVRNDFERFGRRVRPGGALVFDDCFDEGIFRTHVDTVGRLVDEIVREGQFALVKGVNRLAHLERVRSA